MLKQQSKTNPWTVTNKVEKNTKHVLLISARVQEVSQEQVILLTWDLAAVASS